MVDWLGAEKETQAEKGTSRDAKRKELAKEVYLKI